MLENFNEGFKKVAGAAAMAGAVAGAPSAEAAELSTENKYMTPATNPDLKMNDALANANRFLGNLGGKLETIDGKTVLTIQKSAAVSPKPELVDTPREFINDIVQQFDKATGQKTYHEEHPSDK